MKNINNYFNIGSFRFLKISPEGDKICQQQQFSFWLLANIVFRVIDMKISPVGGKMLNLAYSSAT